MVNLRDELSPGVDGFAGTTPVEWYVSDQPVAYQHALDHMDQRTTAIREGRALEQVWLLEHPPLYTAGTSANDEDLLDRRGFPVHRTGRGGQYTYHGPGPEGGLCDARPEGAQAGCPPVRCSA